MKILATLAVLLTTLTLGCSSSGTNDAAKQPSMDEVMAAMMRAGTPGDAHRKLDAFVGTWNAKLKMWMDPAAPAEESTGVMTNAWTLDGRYLEQKFRAPRRPALRASACGAARGGRQVRRHLGRLDEHRDLHRHARPRRTARASRCRWSTPIR
jgi:hypothetical protein